eukprot:TRINITY_DN8504_c1_g1_i1.p1 TRINITY_DN8504_c1_g1~~TRINITY_DN8504_c1_g1_i1.p1  ORF type:complete len:339 (+),score=86.56 TRINITY_DN8504_c1_g1_i1:120-1136(+)
MHGVSKESIRSIDAVKREETRKKIEKFTSLFAEVVSFRKKGRNSWDNAIKEYLGKTAILVEIHPDHYTVWNFRRELLLRAKDLTLDESDAHECDPFCESGLPALQSELGLVQRCLMRNPKSYNSWEQRRWLLLHAHATLRKDLLLEELELCRKFLLLDERNFHCWNHRKTVGSWMNESPRDIMKLSLDMINRNFSNYSAWHHRAATKLQAAADEEEMDDEGERKPGIWDEEFDLARNAVFTDPADQSAWMYLGFMLRKGFCDPDELHEVCTTLLELEEENVEDETGESTISTCKWPLVALSWLYRRYVKSSEEEKDTLRKRLIRVDPIRKVYYEHMLL